MGTRDTHNSTTVSRASSLFGRMSARSSFVSRKDVKVSVQLLHDAESISTEFKRSATGRDVLDYVCECLNLRERDYLGLRYQDHHKYRYWVDLSQSVSSLCKLFKSDSLALRLRFRFYPSNVSQLREELTRYQLSVQLQRDLLHGRLYCPPPVAAQLAAYVLQAQLGDYDEEKAHGGKYVSEFKLLLKQTPKIESRIAELHRELKGMSAGEAERRLIETASGLETYGFDPYTIKEAKNPSSCVYLGATHRGILIYHGSQKAHHLQWSEVAKLDYSGHELRIYPREGYEPVVAPDSTLDLTMASNNNVTKESNGGAGTATPRVLRYACPSRTFAKHLWVHLLSQKAFFNELAADQVKPAFSKPRIPLFTRGSTFRFPSQRVLKEIETSPVEERPQPVCFSRYELPRQAPRSDAPLMTKYQTLPTMKLNGSVPTTNGVSKEEKKEEHTERAKVEELMNVSLLDGLEASSSSSPVAPSPVSSAPSNVSSISVHLVKVEARHSPCSSEANNNEEGPLAHSTPLANGGGLKRRNGGLGGISPVLTANQEEERARKNVSFVLEEKAVSARSRALNAFFVAFLLFVLLFAVALLLFEQEISWAERSHWLEHLKHTYYQPAREAVLQKYRRMLAR